MAAAAGGVLAGIGGLAVGVANLILGRIAADNDKRAAFTQEFVQQASQQYPGYNVVICHPKHTVSGPNVVHQHYELRMTVGTCGYEIYFSPKGHPFSFQNQGDGGFINWAFAGEFNQNGNNLTAH